MKNNLISFEDFKVNIMSAGGIVHAVRGVNLDIREGEIHGIVGESGCGKSMTIKSVLRLHEKDRTEYKGAIYFGKDRRDILKMSGRELNKIRGSEISMVFQDPMVSLNPIMTVGEQISEMLRRKKKLTREEAKYESLQLLEQVGITPPLRRYNQYPFELSGGLIQRVIIAMALACKPRLLIADEPTTALDVTIQVQIMELLKNLQKKYNMAIILVTHNLGVIAELCDRVSVMYAGEIVETGEVTEIFDHPQHPYLRALMESQPHKAKRGEMMPTIPGAPPVLLGKIEGCAFADRCKLATEQCRKNAPVMREVSEGHFSACCVKEKEGME